MEMEGVLQMSSFASLTCYSALKELNDSNTGLITAYARIVAPVILHNSSKRNYDIYSLQKDIEDEYSLKIPFHALKAIVRKCSDLGFITLDQNIIKPCKEKIEADDFAELKKQKEGQFKKFIDCYKCFLKDKYNEYVDDPTAYEHLNEFLEKNGLSFIQEPTPSKFPKERWKVAEFLEVESATVSENINILIEYIAGLSLTQLLSYEESWDRFSENQLTVYLDTPILFRLLGIDSLQRQDIYSEMIRQMQKRGIKIRVFEHTYNEMIGIIINSEEWINNPLFDETLANETSYYFVSNNWTIDEIEELAIKAKTKIEKDLNIQIDSMNYPAKESIKSIHEADLADRIKIEYSRDQISEEIQKKEYSIGLDAKSLFYIVQLLNGNIPLYLKDFKYLFLTTNTALSRISQAISKEVNQGKKLSSMIPFAIDDTTWGTILWLDTPSNLNKYSRAKLSAAAYASFRPTDTIIQKFYNSLLELSEKGEITPEECYMLRTQPSARGLLLRLTQNDETRCLDSTPLEIIKQYKNAGYQQGIDEKNQEIARIEEETERKIHQLHDEKKSEFERANSAEERAICAELEVQLLKLKDKKEKTSVRIEDLGKEADEIKKNENKAEKHSKFLVIGIKILLTLILALIIYYFGRKLVQYKDLIEFGSSIIIALGVIWLGSRFDGIALKLTEKVKKRFELSCLNDITLMNPS
ncbi:MAG: hypothetical protein K5705_15375 [Oscillospiraceae bacterium]|nr:hypothetical protein [Oscillospiraceae bacterium]